VNIIESQKSLADLRAARDAAAARAAMKPLDPESEIKNLEAQISVAQAAAAAAAAELDRDLLALEQAQRALREDDQAIKTFVIEATEKARTMLKSHQARLEAAQALERSISDRQHPNDYLEVQTSSPWWRALGSPAVLAECERVTDAQVRAEKLAAMPEPEPDPMFLATQRARAESCRIYREKLEEERRRDERRALRAETREVTDGIAIENARRQAIDDKRKRDFPEATNPQDFRPALG
jgi:hypothetical protein